MNQVISLIPPVRMRDHTAGTRDADVTLVEYADYQCPYCAEAYFTVKRLQRALGKSLRFVFRNFPLEDVHPYAQIAAQAAEAAGLQGQFWEMHDIIFENQNRLTPDILPKWAKKIGLDLDEFVDSLEDGHITKRIKEDRLSGMKSGVDGTPTYFINGVKYDGSLDFNPLRSALETHHRRE